MYHNHIHTWLIGLNDAQIQTIQSVPVPENLYFHFYTADFPLSKSQMDALEANASLVICAIPESFSTDGMHWFFEQLQAANNPEIKCIACIRDKQAGLLEPYYHWLEDIWPVSPDGPEIGFYARKLMEKIKTSSDLWYTTQCMETAMDSTSNIVWFKDKNGIHCNANEAFCKLVGKKKSDIKGKDHAWIWDVDPSEASDCDKSDREVMETRKLCINEECVYAGKEQKILTTFKSPLFDLDGSVMGTAGVGVDITLEKAYEKEVIAKNHTLQSIFSSLDCGLIVHTADGQEIRQVNQRALDILGYPTKEALLADGFNMYTSKVVDEDKPELDAAFESLKEPGQTVEVEYRVRHADQSITHIVGSIKLLEQNGQRFYQRFLLDSTAQKQKEKEVQNQHEELLKALTIDYRMVCTLDLAKDSAQYLQADEYYRNHIDPGKLLESDAPKAIHRYIEKYVYPEDQEQCRSLLLEGGLEQKLETHPSYSIAYQFTDQDNVRFYEAKCVRIGCWNENSKRIVLGIRNVDSMTRKEMEQRRLLEGALDQANRANKAKSLFLSNMSHDIRTPMNAIIGFTNLAMNRIGDPEIVGRYLEKIQASGTHLLSLINDILDMSSIESGQFVLDEEECALREIIGNLDSIVRVDASSRDLNFTIAVTDPEILDTRISCDKLRLNQLLLNILSNAVKYTRPGGQVHMSVSLLPDSSPALMHCQFKVCDTGIGMSEEYVSHIFEQFSRERNSTTSGIQGTGLGMAITKNIVDMMNGTIQVESTQSVGTQVTVTIPFAIKEPVHLQPQPVQTLSLAELTKLAKENRILAVEDNDLNREIILEILEDAGFKADSACNGLEAIEMLKEHDPEYYQLILMDVQMPGLNGYQATRRIRAMEDPRLARIPILAMTANAFEEDRRSALASGMNGHVAKPLNIEELYRILHSMLQNK